MMTMQVRNYCTLFNINYVAYARSLYDSLDAINEPYMLFMFCMCDESYDFLSKLDLKNAKLVHYSELEEFIPELLVAKANRSMVEYFYTCSPCICDYVLNQNSHIDMVTYLDADLYFFSSPEPIFQELNTNSIGIISHDFSWWQKRSLQYGKYNVGWINFRKDEDGLKCLGDWKRNCLDWCYQKVEKDRYADQKYLNFWPENYNNVHEITNKGANLAMWNLAKRKLTKVNSVIFVNEDKLIFYHFANLKQINENVFKTELSRLFIPTKGILKDDIYVPYIKMLIKNKYKNAKIVAKKDIHLSNFKAKIINLSKIIRQSLFPDLIEINTNAK